MFHAVVSNSRDLYVRCYIIMVVNHKTVTGLCHS
jgi:hypothetical protein